MENEPTSPAPVNQLVGRVCIKRTRRYFMLCEKTEHGTPALAAIDTYDKDQRSTYGLLVELKNEARKQFGLIADGIALIDTMLGNPPNGAADQPHGRRRASSPQPVAAAFA